MPESVLMLILLGVSAAVPLCAENGKITFNLGDGIWTPSNPTGQNAGTSENVEAACQPSIPGGVTRAIPTGSCFRKRSRLKAQVPEGLMGVQASPLISRIRRGDSTPEPDVTTHSIPGFLRR